MSKAGRKSKYDEAVKPYLEQINKKVREGIIESEIAKSLGISVATLNNYKLQYPELKEALSKDKGADVLQSLVNNGIQAAKGYYKDEVTITESEKNGKTVTTTRRWYPANPTLHLFYAKLYGKDEGFVSDPLEYELKKAKQELDEAIQREKNWDANLDQD